MTEYKKRDKEIRELFIEFRKSLITDMEPYWVVINEIEEVKTYPLSTEIVQNYHTIFYDIENLRPIDTQSINVLFDRIDKFIIQTEQFQTFIVHFMVLNVRESLILDDTTENIRYNLKRLMDFERQNGIETNNYRKYPQTLIDSTKADIDRLAAIRQIENTSQLLLLNSTELELTDHLEGKLLATKEKHQNTEGNNDLKDRIEDAFWFMRESDPRKHQIILNEEDFQKLVTWVANYFENNFIVPEITEPIRSIKTNKGNVIFAFKQFFKDEHPTKTRPDSLYELVKACFYEYREDKLNNLKKVSEPQFYWDLAHKNKGK